MNPAVSLSWSHTLPQFALLCFSQYYDKESTKGNSDTYSSSVMRVYIKLFNKTHFKINPQILLEDYKHLAVHMLFDAKKSIIGSLLIQLQRGSAHLCRNLFEFLDHRVALLNKSIALVWKLNKNSWGIQFEANGDAAETGSTNLWGRCKSATRGSVQATRGSKKLRRRITNRLYNLSFQDHKACQCSHKESQEPPAEAAEHQEQKY